MPEKENRHHARERPRRFSIRPDPNYDNPHNLMPRWLCNRIPQLYTTENDADPQVQARFFTRDSPISWYVIEFDGDTVFFGLIDNGTELQPDAFSIQELQVARGPLGCRIERDVYFDPKPLSQI